MQLKLIASFLVMCNPQQDQILTNSGSETSAWYWQMTLPFSRPVCVLFWYTCTENVQVFFLSLPKRYSFGTDQQFVWVMFLFGMEWCFMVFLCWIWALAGQFVVPSPLLGEYQTGEEPQQDKAAWCPTLCDPNSIHNAPFTGYPRARWSLVTLPTFWSLVTLPTSLGRVASDYLVVFSWPCSHKNTSHQIPFVCGRLWPYLPLG